jgi:hypothetical protein
MSTARSGRGFSLSTLAISALLACTSATSGVATNPRLIARDEIQRYMSGGTSDLYELVQRARPRWLQERSERSLNLETVILVYLNQQRLGGPDALRSLKPDNVMRIRWLDSAAAAALPGARDQHVESAIVVETSSG